MPHGWRRRGAVRAGSRTAETPAPMQRPPAPARRPPRPPPTARQPAVRRCAAPGVSERDGSSTGAPRSLRRVCSTIGLELPALQHTSAGACGRPRAPARPPRRPRTPRRRHVPERRKSDCSGIRASSGSHHLDVAARLKFATTRGSVRPRGSIGSLSLVRERLLAGQRGRHTGVVVETSDSVGNGGDQRHATTLDECRRPSMIVPSSDQYDSHSQQEAGGRERLASLLSRRPADRPAAARAEHAADRRRRLLLGRARSADAPAA